MKARILVVKKDKLKMKNMPKYEKFKQNLKYKKVVSLYSPTKFFNKRKHQVSNQK